ncbi:MAG: AMP-binding protein, partial [Lachnospiraceae bacterium]|nr:AMP-binding protein [Lachnospiraceae bacterium]
MTNVLEFLENSAERFPGKTAFLDPARSLTFFELRDVSRQIGSLFLSGALGVQVRSEEAVAFYMEKSAEAVAAMFGAVYAGAFYSFIDVRQPEERALQVFSILKPAVIITDEENEEALQKICETEEGLKCQRIRIGELLRLAGQTEIYENLLAEARNAFYDQIPLYVNFTSGSTGVPKGVAVGHRSVIDFITVFTETFSLSPSDILGNQAPFDFDVSVKDIYSGLYTGATVVLIPRDYFSKPQILMDYLSDNQVTVLVWAVSAMCFVSIMNGLEYKTPETVRMVMFSGELMPVKQLRKWKKNLPNAVYINLYGPTEITCNCTWYELDREFADDELIPIGKPFGNEKVFLLDKDDTLIDPSEIGKEGELCVSGT